jgi:hypothetical protein
MEHYNTKKRKTRAVKSDDIANQHQGGGRSECWHKL